VGVDNMAEKRARGHREKNHAFEQIYSSMIDYTTGVNSNTKRV